MRQRVLTWSLSLLIAVALVPVSSYNFLLFHSIAEVIAIVVLMVIFVITFTAKESLESDGPLIVFGYASPFVALILMLHMLAYKGLGVFPEHLLPDLTTQLWLISRFVLAGTFLSAALAAGRRVRPGAVVVVAAATTVMLLLTVSVWPVFPVAFHPETGLTGFKIVTEYAVMAAFAITAGLVFRQRALYDKSTFRALIVTLGFLILTELSFTLYGTALAGPFNVIGHLTQVFAFQALYLANVEVSIRRPFDSVFRTLKTSQEQIRAKAEYYERLYELAPIPYQSLDESGNFLTVNRAWTQATGFAKEDVIGRSFASILSPEVSSAFAERFEGFKAAGAVRDIEWRIVMPDGKEMITEFDGVIARASDGTFLQTHCVLRDVTDDRRRDAIRQEQADHLESEVRRRTEELERANAAKGEFLANVSHELRTPLNSIIGFSDILLGGLAGDLDDEQRRQLQMIRDSGGHLLSIVNDILDLARVDVGKMEIASEDVDLPALVRDVFASMAPLAVDRSLEMTFSECTRQCERCIAHVDPVRVHQVLNNLMGNAVKFTTAGSVSVLLDCDGVSTAYVRVQDTGPGLSRTQLEQVFDEFIQVAGRDGSKPEGTGLGLPLSRRIARAFGGEVLAHSVLGRGSTFTLVLPLVGEQNDDQLE